MKPNHASRPHAAPVTAGVAGHVSPIVSKPMPADDSPLPPGEISYEPESCTPGVAAIAAERARLLTKFTAEHDDAHADGEMAAVAAKLLTNVPDQWGLVKKHSGSRLERLVCAGQLVAAEIDRELRAEASKLPSAL